MKEAPSSAPPTAFPSDKHHAWYAVKSFMRIYAYLVMQNIEKASTKRLWFDEISIFFSVSWRLAFSENDCFFCKCVTVKNF